MILIRNKIGNIRDNFNQLGVLLSENSVIDHLNMDPWATKIANNIFCCPKFKRKMGFNNQALVSYVCYENTFFWEFKK